MIIWLIDVKTFLRATYNVIDEFWRDNIGARP